MKIIFVFVEIEGDQRLDFYPGLATLSSVLKGAGHEISLIRTAQVGSDEHFVDLLKHHQPNLIGFSVMSNFVTKAGNYANLAKKHLPEIPVVFGGVHSTLEPDEVIRYDYLDYVCVGEGEEAFSELCNSLEGGKDTTGIENIWAKTQGSQISKNEVRPLIADLDLLPYPDRDLFPYQNTFDALLKRSTFMASRGCPYKCTYCSDPLRETYKTGYVRFRTVDHLIQEIEMVVKRHKSEYVAFHDDILTLRRDWFEDFARKYRKKIALPFRCNTRIDLLDKELVRFLKEAGCHRLNVGLESGNEYIRAEVLGRRISNQQYIKVFEYCKEEGIATHTTNMLGLPYENLSRLLDTVVFNARLRPTSVQVSYFYPYPKTKLYELCRREGFLSGKEVDSYFIDTTLELPNLSCKELRYVFKNFERLIRLFEMVYLMPSIISRIYNSVLRSVVLRQSSLIFPIAKIVGAARSIRYAFKRILLCCNQREGNA